MKAISMWQPWASLWAVRRKRYETRHWATSYRGELLVHAAKKICVDIDVHLLRICENEFGENWAAELPRGALIARCTLLACIATDQLSIAERDEEFWLGNFGPGRFAWDSENMTALERPIPWRGMQALFNVPDDIVGMVPAPAPNLSLF